jgi:hypothetical protein
MSLLKQSTARNKMVFMTAASDHVAGLAGLTLTITASKDGAAFASISPTVTDRGSGWYNLALTTAHTDTLGDFNLHITGAAADPTDLAWEVVALLPGDPVTLAADSVNSTSVAASAVTEIQTGLATSAALATVQTDTDDIQTRLPATLVGGRMRSHVEAMDADVITATVLAASAITEIQAGLATSAEVAVVLADTNDIQTRLPAALVGGRMDSSVGAMAADVLTASALATDAVDEIVDQAWNEALAGHLVAGSTGAALNAAGGAGDPWITALPGAYGVGTAGFILGTNLDAQLSLVKAKTDPLAFTVANRVDANTRSMNSAAVQGNGTAGDLWRG